jgi:omega-6 fatty acid desaturase (delta-12 desaturase)
MWSIANEKGSVPNEISSNGGQFNLTLYDFLGDDAFAVWHLFAHLVMGWPLYLLTGATGSPKRGYSNHFLPTNDSLFPDAWKYKVFVSSIGVGAMVTLLWNLGKAYGFTPIVALYGGPYLVANGWLVLYTWLQHTDGIRLHWLVQRLTIRFFSRHTALR